MYRRFLTTSTKELLQIASSPSCSHSVLEEIMAELAERKNEYAFRALLKVGKLLEQARDEEMRHEVEERQRVEALKWRRRNLEGFFEWPSTDAPASTYGFVGDVFFYKDGLLSYVGYQVGHDGVQKHIRLQILDCVFHNELPRVISPRYMNEWGKPKTAARLHKLADALAAFTRNAKRRTQSDMSEAIADWASDLDYLFHKYYIGKFGFAWPDQ